MEPHLPAPALWVAGTTPIAAALAELGAGDGLRRDASSIRSPSASLLPAGDPGRRRRRPRRRCRSPRSGRTSSSPARASGTRRRSPRRSGSDVAYVGLVASPTRAAAVRTWLLDEGIEPDRVLRDAGAGRARPRRRDGRRGRRVDPGRARPGPPRPGRRSSPRPGPATLAGAAAAGGAERGPEGPVVDDIVLLDPVCGMTVDRAHVRHIAEHGGSSMRSARSAAGRASSASRPPTSAAGIADRRLTARRPEDPMHFEGTVEIAAPRDKVWSFVTDPTQVGPVRPRRRVGRARSTTPTSRPRPRSASGSSAPGSTPTAR